MRVLGIIAGAKYLSLLLCFVAIFSLAGCSSIAKHEGYISTSLNEISKDPWKYHGKVVRVSGTFNECKSYSCDICPGKAYKKSYDEDRTNKCMGVSFESRYLEKYARYATVIIEADYDAGCSGVMPSRKDSSGDEDEIIVCTDRASQMINTRVIKIIMRRAASQGHISSYGLAPLIVPDETIADALKSTFLQQKSPVVDIESSELEFIFLTDISDVSGDDDYKNIKAEGGVCVCNEGIGKCDKIWPTLEGHIFGLPIDNPYECWIAQKIDGKWRYPVPQ